MNWFGKRRSRAPAAGLSERTPGGAWIDPAATHTPDQAAPAAEAPTAAPDAPPSAATAAGSDMTSMTPAPVPPTPDEALEILKAGNQAFLNGELDLSSSGPAVLQGLVGGQHPVAVVVGCADSRTSPALLFNQGLGKLFSVRVAGNTVDACALASIVYAVEQLGCPLIVVMGHTGCGAVAAAEAVVDGQSPLEPSLEAMILPIIPAVLEARRHSPADASAAAVEENARRVADGLFASAAIAEAVAQGRLKVIAAVKEMRTGVVTFLDWTRDGT